MQETIVKRSNLLSLIIRSNFIPYKKFPHEKAFSDRTSNYFFAPELAKEIKNTIDKKILGTVHILGDEILSMYDMAKLCPDSENVKPMTLEEYYKENPNSPKLTKNMVLNSIRWNIIRNMI